MLKISKNKKGISVIEILVVVVILLIGLIGVFNLLSFSLQISSLIKETTQANFMAQEMIEAIRNFRDGTTWDSNGIGTLNIDTAYHLEKTSDIPPKWAMVSGEETINGFSRKAIFKNAGRDINDNVVESGGTNDLETKKAIITISWKDKQVEIVTYFTNWR